MRLGGCEPIDRCPVLKDYDDLVYKDRSGGRLLSRDHINTDIYYVITGCSRVQCLSKIVSEHFNTFFRYTSHDTTEANKNGLHLTH